MQPFSIYPKKSLQIISVAFMMLFKVQMQPERAI